VETTDPGDGRRSCSESGSRSCSGSYAEAEALAKRKRRRPFTDGLWPGKLPGVVRPGCFGPQEMYVRGASPDGCSQREAFPLGTSHCRQDDLIGFGEILLLDKSVQVNTGFQML
jgi:hypothetical protein